MEVNLKDVSKQILELKHLKKQLLQQNADPKKSSRLIDKIVLFYEEVESDLELCGESIIEIDKPRLEAIEERNKMLSFIKEEDL
jgi:hypothetical protein